MKFSYQDELYQFIDNEFERKVLQTSIEEMNPDSILQKIKEIIREKLNENKNT